MSAECDEWERRYGSLKAFSDRMAVEVAFYLADRDRLAAALGRVEALCDEAEYVVLATDDPGTAPVKAVAVSDLMDPLTPEVSP